MSQHILRPRGNTGNVCRLRHYNLQAGRGRKTEPLGYQWLVRDVSSSSRNFSGSSLSSANSALPSFTPITGKGAGRPFLLLVSVIVVVFMPMVVPVVTAPFVPAPILRRIPPIIIPMVIVVPIPFGVTLRRANPDSIRGNSNRLLRKSGGTDPSREKHKHS